MNPLARLLQRLTAWIDRQTEAIQAAAASDEPAVDDALEALDFATPCGAGPHGYLIRGPLQCPNPAAVDVIVYSFDPADDTHVHELWCVRCYAMYRTALHAFGFSETQVNEHLHVKAI